MASRQVLTCSKYGWNGTVGDNGLCGNVDDGEKQFIRLTNDPVEQAAALRVARYSDPCAKLSEGNGDTGTVIIVHNDAASMAVKLTVNHKPKKFKVNDKRG